MNCAFLRAKTLLNLSMDAHGGTLPPKIFTKLVNKNANKTQKVAQSHLNFYNPKDPPQK
jgi:hypothetical protein